MGKNSLKRRNLGVTRFDEGQTMMWKRSTGSILKAASGQVLYSTRFSVRFRRMSTLDDTPPSDSLSGFYGWTDTLKGVYYGPGAVTTALPQLLDRLGAKKALVVTGRTLYQK
ncbi:hypothetical protein NMY22_g4836 [Coprinellus aureogranulatus]|nr:hypothetical protein NMY22_g4836 [Coprinellus aureogranulatus]